MTSLTPFLVLPLPPLGQVASVPLKQLSGSLVEMATHGRWRTLTTHLKAHRIPVDTVLPRSDGSSTTFVREAIWGALHRHDVASLAPVIKQALDHGWMGVDDGLLAWVVVSLQESRPGRRLTVLQNTLDRHLSTRFHWDRRGGFTHFLDETLARIPSWLSEDQTRRLAPSGSITADNALVMALVKSLQRAERMPRVGMRELHGHDMLVSVADQAALAHRNDDGHALAWRWAHHVLVGCTPDWEQGARTGVWPSMHTEAQTLVRDLYCGAWHALELQPMLDARYATPMVPLDGMALHTIFGLLGLRGNGVESGTINPKTRGYNTVEDIAFNRMLSEGFTLDPSLLDHGIRWARMQRVRPQLAVNLEMLALKRVVDDVATTTKLERSRL